MIEFTMDTSGMVLDVDALELEITAKFAAIAEMIGVETIAYLRSLTSEMRPPIKAGGKWRKAHPGHWADRRSTLALSYAYEVVEQAGLVTLILRNTAEYAIYLELHDGFFVLSGVTDDNGPAEQALRRAAKRVAPEWTFEAGGSVGEASA